MRMFARWFRGLSVSVSVSCRRTSFVWIKTQRKVIIFSTKGGKPILAARTIERVRSKRERERERERARARGKE